MSNSRNHRWSAEEERYLADHYPTETPKELVAGLERKFGFRYTWLSVRTKCRNLNLHKVEGYNELKMQRMVELAHEPCYKNKVSSSIHKSLDKLSYEEEAREIRRFIGVTTRFQGGDSIEYESIRGQLYRMLDEIGL